MQYIPDVQRAWHRICAGWKTKESKNKREAGLLLGVIEGGEEGGGRLRGGDRVKYFTTHFRRYALGLVRVGPKLGERGGKGEEEVEKV